MHAGVSPEMPTIYVQKPAGGAPPRQLVNSIEDGGVGRGFSLNPSEENLRRFLQLIECPRYYRKIKTLTPFGTILASILPSLFLTIRGPGWWGRSRGTRGQRSAPSEYAARPPPGGPRTGRVSACVRGGSGAGSRGPGVTGYGLRR